MRPKYEVAEIIQEYGDDFYRKHKVSFQAKRTLYALSVCRTAVLGGHVEKCNSEKCGHERIAYNSCRNRHCPKCQSSNRERWIMAREEDLLNVTYFHVVFTLPLQINVYCLKYPKELYNMLFQASKETLFVFGKDPKHLGAQMGAISVLHTWGQNLSLHPHVHMIVPAGGFTKDNEWKSCKSNGGFLFPAKAMAKVYRGKFMEKILSFLKEKNIPMEVSLRRNLYDKNWVVYAKEPFKSPKNVIEYLGRYSHKTAISNHRIKNIKNGRITFSFKDYRHAGVTKNMTLEVHEFLRRFCQHILPPRFVKIRHYGFLSSRIKQKLKIGQMKCGMLPRKKENVNAKSDYREIAKERLGFDIDACPCCKTGKMIIVMQFGANAPPIKISNKRKQMINNKI